VAYTETSGTLAPGRSALAALIPLALVRHLHNIGGDPYTERDQLELLEHMADALLAGKPDPGGFEARNVDQISLTARGIPKLVSERLWLTRRFRAYLRENPSGDLWAQIKVPRVRRPEEYGFWCIVPLIDYAVRNESYDDTVVPAMLAVSEVCAFFRLLDRGVEDSFEFAGAQVEVMFGGQAVVNEIVTADDPAAAAAQVRRELADDSSQGAES